MSPPSEVRVGGIFQVPLAGIPYRCTNWNRSIYGEREAKRMHVMVFLLSSKLIIYMMKKNLASCVLELEGELEATGVSFLGLKMHGFLIF